jgi:hypothetical protein
MVLSLLVFYAIVRVDFFGDWRLWDFTWADQVFNDTEATLRDKGFAVFGIPMLWLLWLRGISRGQQTLDFESVVGAFAVGVVVIAMVEALQGGDVPEGVRYVAVPYVGVGLLAIGLAHAGRAELEYGRSFAPTWLIAVGGTVAVLATVSLLFVVIDFGTATELLASAVKAIGSVVATVFYYIMWPIVKAIEGIMIVVRALIEALFSGAERQEPQEQEPAEGQPEENPNEIPGWLDLLVRIIVGGALVTMILFALALAFRRFQRRRRPGETKESTYQEGRLTADLSDLFGAFVGRLRRGTRVAQERDPLRRLYFEMLATGAERGIERQTAETPLELAPRLDQVFRAETPARITSAFDDSRYGGISPPKAEVERLSDEWKQLKEGRQV